MTTPPTLSVVTSLSTVNASSAASALVFSSTFLVAMSFCRPSVSVSWSANAGGLLRVSTATALAEAANAALPESCPSV